VEPETLPELEKSLVLDPLFEERDCRDAENGGEPKDADESM
jgi:hypothetical protein